MITWLSRLHSSALLRACFRYIVKDMDFLSLIRFLSGDGERCFDAALSWGATQLPPHHGSQLLLPAIGVVFETGWN